MWHEGFYCDQTTTDLSSQSNNFQRISLRVVFLNMWSLYQNCDVRNSMYRHCHMPKSLFTIKLKHRWTECTALYPKLQNKPPTEKRRWLFSTLLRCRTAASTKINTIKTEWNNSLLQKHQCTTTAAETQQTTSSQGCGWGQKTWSQEAEKQGVPRHALYDAVNLLLHFLRHPRQAVPVSVGQCNTSPVQWQETTNSAQPPIVISLQWSSLQALEQSTIKSWLWFYSASL